MTRLPRPCIGNNQRPCPTRALTTNGNQCDKCRQTTTQRGYGTKHQAKRREWEPMVAAGVVFCWRCGETIQADEPWELGHDDVDRNVYRGPEHFLCNRRAAGKASQQTWA